MRALFAIVVAVIAGCGSSSSSGSDMQAAGATDMALAVCSQSLDAFCAARGDCKRDLTTAMQASSWCADGGTGVTSVVVQHCAGGQTVIVATYIDNADEWVYAGGALVAVFAAAPHMTSSLACIAGPATFAAPTGCDAGTQLCS